MVPFIIYWIALLVGVAWIFFSIFEFIFYMVKKENGNLWFIAPLNFICLLVLLVIVLLYRGNDGFGIDQYTSLYLIEIVMLIVLTVADIIFGKTRKVA
ncbi:MAG: hypothetical protein LBD38_05510 [Streptococcaceae bacterium]|jgi:hypothetical protein|nr:hypothetical protein [Streptococcaceae bacterium]